MLPLHSFHSSTSLLISAIYILGARRIRALAVLFFNEYYVIITGEGGWATRAGRYGLGGFLEFMDVISHIARIALDS